MSRVFNVPKNNDFLPGWYKYGRLDQAALCVSDSSLGLPGEIRFNKSKNIFEGYNGTRWIILDSYQGEKGDSGRDFNKIVSFEVNDSQRKYVSVNSCNLVEPVELDTSAMNKCVVNVRQLNSDVFHLNGCWYKSLNISQNSSDVKLGVPSRPHIWDMREQSIEDMKEIDGNGESKCWGDMYEYRAAENILRGQFVRSCIDVGHLCVITVNYDKNKKPNFYSEPINVIGVALNDAKLGDKCKVCTRGITQVMVSNEGGYLRCDNDVMQGSYGAINCEGKVVKIGRKPMSDFIRAGQFMEKGGIKKNELMLFKVDIQLISD